MPGSNDLERRAAVQQIERRAAGDLVTVAGYAAVFGEEANIGGFFREVIARGAFAESLRTADVRAYFGHDRNRVLGRMSVGTLRLREDEKGLAVEIDLPDTSDGRDAQVSIQRGDISGMSFGFNVRANGQEWDESQPIPLRTLLAVDLIEVSIVGDPAYDGTSVALRSLDAARKERRQHNFSGAQRRLAMKATLDLRARSLETGSKA